MMNRSYFAAVCLVAVVAAELTPRTEFKLMNLESHLLRRPHYTSRKPHRDNVPNWMLGFYGDDELDTERHVERIHEPSFSHVESDYHPAVREYSHI